MWIVKVGVGVATIGLGWHCRMAVAIMMIMMMTCMSSTTMTTAAAGVQRNG
jgi:hypothetical protein